MILPSTLQSKAEWTFVGPMGPAVPEALLAHPVMGVDGGAHFSSRIDLWVGDADSLMGTVNSPYKYEHPREKAQSDLALAFAFFTEHLLYKFHLWGFLGGRRDHELFNLGEAMHFLEEHPEAHIIFYDERGLETFHLLGAGLWKFHHIGPFSLGSLKKVAVKLTGNCQYPIPRFRNLLPLSSFGLSNVGAGEVVIESEGPVFVHFPEGK